MNRNDLALSYVSWAFRSQGKRDKKVTTAIPTYNTPSGQYTREEWINKLEDQIDARAERGLYEQLKEFLRARTIWIKNDEDKEEYARSFYSRRTFENKQWVDYSDFQSFIKE